MNKKQRVIFCSYSSIYSSLVLQHLLAAESIEVVAIVNSTRVLKKGYGHIKGAWEQLKLSGLHYSSTLFIATDMFSLLQPLSRLKSIAYLAKQNNIPILHTLDINEAAALAYLKPLKADFILAAHFNQRIESDVLALPKVACLNIHPGKLPNYRGVDPVFYALLDQQKTLSVTLHLMEENFDTGQIIAEQALELSSKHNHNNVLAYSACLFDQGAKLAVNTLSHGLSETKPQASGGRYDSWPSRAVVKRFLQQDHHLWQFSSFVNLLRGGFIKSCKFEQ